MKQILQILIFLCIATATYAQSNLEAKMAYQMAEEKFDAKQYTEALDYLEKAETALGSTNPPMLFLKVMISNQIVTAKESTDNYRKLEKAIADFDKHKDKNALGEEKQMEVYRIKMDLDKRKNAYEKWEDNLLNEYHIYGEMAKRIANQYPKTGITVTEFLDLPSSFDPPILSYGVKPNAKRIAYLIKKGESWFIPDSQLSNSTGLTLGYLSTSSKGIDTVKYYTAEKFVKKGEKNGSDYDMTKQQVIDLFNIPKELHEGISWDENSFIGFVKNSSGKEYYRINYESQEKKENGEPKRLSILIDSKIYIKSSGTSYYILIRVFENTL